LRAVVVGAGAFGGWTALALRRRGAHVTLVEAWGPAHSRASSGGESRVIRAAYGSRSIYTTLTLRSLDLWRAHDPGRRLLHETGVLWLFGEDDSFGRTSAQVLHDHGGSLDSLSLSQASRRYPQVRFDGVRSVFWEKEAGYLLSRRACENVVDRLTAEGGEYRQSAVPAPMAIDAGGLRRLALDGGATLDADAFVFACGPWLPGLFPDVAAAITSSRQEVFYFGTPPGDARFTVRDLPVWMDFAAGSRAGQVYGVPASGGSGFKVADDTTGPPIDPGSGQRIASPEGEAKARAFLSRRFPELAGAPLIASEVCQYESTPDAHLLVDRHPLSPNVWLLGGGSGHGFKMGPAIGEMMADLLLNGGAPDAQFSLARFVQPPTGGWTGRWS
jgi:glycine/D-amino acid oxidase-like deaminating enzyme